MALDPVTAVLDIGGKLIDRMWPDPAQAATAKLELIKLQQSGDQEVKIKLDGWKKKDKEGNHMVSLKVNTYEKKQQPQVSDPWDN